MEDFRGDFEQLAEVMKASWGENESPPFLYTPSFLANLFDYPGATFGLAPAIYHGSRLTAFAAGFPRLIRYDGKDARVLVVALLTVASEQKSKGYGIVVWSELMRRARAAGFDGAFNYCIEGEAMNRMVEGSCRRLRIPVCRIHTVSYRSRVVRTAGDGDPDDRVSPSARRLMDASAEVAHRVPLARIWTVDEAAWQCSREGFVGVCREGGGASGGVLAGYVMPIANRDRTKCLIAEDVLWGDLAQDAREALAGDFVAKGAAAGARIAIVPDLGYTDIGPFGAVGFRPSQQKIHAYLSLWNGDAPDGPLSGYYLDVF